MKKFEYGILKKIETDGSQVYSFQDTILNKSYYDRYSNTDEYEEN